MGFFAENDVRVEPRGKAGTPSNKLLHELGCKACPLNHAKVRSPKMKPTGNVAPDVYMLGGAPSEDDDRNGSHFTGIAGNYLRDKIPKEWKDRLRWDNVIRDRAVGGPDAVSTECCRPLVTASIETTKPTAIFGFGNTALKWATGKYGIANWRGRHMPVKVGDHVCWFFAFDHPADLLQARHATKNQKLTEDERMFALDLKRAFALLPELPYAEVHTPEQARAGVDSMLACDDADALFVEEWLAWAATRPLVGYDYETSGGLRPYAEGTRLLTLALSAGDRTLAFALDHPKARWSPANHKRIWAALRKFLLVPHVRKAVHNLAFELEWTGVKIGREYIRAGRWDDTMSQAFVLDQRVGGHSVGGDDAEGVMECFGLGFLTQLHFGIDIKTLSKVDKKDMASEPLENILPYNGIDAKYHKLLCSAQDAALAAEGLTHVYENNQLPRVPTTVLTQMKGIPVDNKMAEAMKASYNKELDEVGKQIAALPITKDFFRRTGSHLNVMSNTDMVVVCRDFLKSEVGKKVKRVNGQEKVSYSVDESTLEQIDHPIMPLTLRTRGLSKLKSTYVFTADNKVVWPGSLLHPLFNTVRARTARLSSSDPNFQNLPKRDAEAKEIRKQFKAWKGRRFLAADYGQIEARVFAMASKDLTYIKMLWEDYDVHAEWARRLAMAYPKRIGGSKNLDDKVVMKKFRDDVKGGWVFALFFGAQLSTAAKQVEIPEEYLKGEYNRFWHVFSGLKDWQERNQKFYHEHGYVEGLTGRRRCGPLSFNQTINTPIQLTAAEIVMDGMCRISELNNWETQPIWNIHDDLGFHFADGNIDDCMEIVAREMVKINFDFINVPLMAEISIGDTMYDLKEIGKISSRDFGHRQAA